MYSVVGFSTFAKLYSVTTIVSNVISSLRKKPHPPSLALPLPPHAEAWATPDLLSIHVDLPILDIPYKGTIQGSSTLWRVPVPQSFLWLNPIPSGRSVTFCSSVLLIDIWHVTTF